MEEDQVFDPSVKKKKKKKTTFDLDTVLDDENVNEEETISESTEKKKKKKQVDGTGVSLTGEENGLENNVIEDSDVFDLNSKKKKKKKKLPADFDTELGSIDQATDASSKDKENQQPSLNVEEDNFDLEDLSKKKKKKKKATFNLDELETVLTETANKSSENADGMPDSNAEEDLNLDMDFSTMIKKKKKKKKDLDELVGEEVECKLENKMEELEDTGRTWSGSDRDYTYDELLTRVFEIMREKNPDMVSGKKQKFMMRPPQVVRIGSKKTSFANFTEICKMLHRLQKHLLDFLLAELGTSGSVDGNNQLIIKGRFQQKQIENVLKRYIKEYVTCHTCKSPETILQKDTRLFFLQCQTCGSRCSVASIKSGFQAVTGKRAAIRAKTA